MKTASPRSGLAFVACVIEAEQQEAVIGAWKLSPGYRHIRWLINCPKRIFSFSLPFLWRACKLLEWFTCHPPPRPNVAPLIACVCRRLTRRLPVSSRHQHPVDNAGLFSFLTFHWISPLALKAYRASSLSLDDVWGLSYHETSDINCQRWSERVTSELHPASTKWQKWVCAVEPVWGCSIFISCFTKRLYWPVLCACSQGLIYVIALRLRAPLSY